MVNKFIYTMWDEIPINITQEANFIGPIANKIRGSYIPDKYGDLIKYLIENIRPWLNQHG